MGTPTHFQPERRYPRAPLNKRFVGGVQRDGTMHLVYGESFDISEGGIGGRLEPELRPGEVVMLDLPLSLLAEPLHAEAVVRYWTEQRCGLEFQYLTEEQRAVIRRKVDGRKAV